MGKMGSHEEQAPCREDKALIQAIDLRPFGEKEVEAENGGNRWGGLKEEPKSQSLRSNFLRDFTSIIFLI